MRIVSFFEVVSGTLNKEPSWVGQELVWVRERENTLYTKSNAVRKVKRPALDLVHRLQHIRRRVSGRKRVSGERAGERDLAESTVKRVTVGEDTRKIMRVLSVVSQ